jgi:hypothetical protein
MAGLVPAIRFFDSPFLFRAPGCRRCEERAPATSRTVAQIRGEHATKSMSQKSGNRFSEKDMRQQKNPEHVTIQLNRDVL